MEVQKVLSLENVPFLEITCRREGMSQRKDTDGIRVEPY